MPTAASINIPQGVRILAPIPEEYAPILTPPALAFLSKLARNFEMERQTLLARRVDRQKEISAGKKLAFLEETRTVREGNWKVAPIPAGLENRRVEITGPTDRKMVINALNSGANVFMADF